MASGSWGEAGTLLRPAFGACKGVFMEVNGGILWEQGELGVQADQRRLAMSLAAAHVPFFSGLLSREPCRQELQWVKIDKPRSDATLG